MRRRRARAILVCVALMPAAACTLLNPLDRLQAGLGDAGAIDGRAPDAADDREDPNAPGCPPDQWSACGVTVLVDSGAPTLVVSDTGGRAVYADPESGTITEIRCYQAQCEPPRPWVTEEKGLAHLAFPWLDAVWTRGNELRGAELYGGPDSGLSQARTIRAAPNPTAAHSNSFATLWADDDGVHHFHVNRAVITPYDVHELLTQQRATEVLCAIPKAYFVSGGEVFTCDYGVNDNFRCAAAPVPIEGSRGAILLGNATGFAAGDAGGAIATRSAGGGTEIVLLEQRDAGALVVVTSEASEIVSVSAAERDIWFTTKSGALRRRTVEVAAPITVLRGLGARARVAAARDQAYVADPDRHLVLRVVR